LEMARDPALLRAGAFALERAAPAACCGVEHQASLTAIAGAWLEGHPLTLGILGDVPPMISEAHAAGQALAQIHTILGDAVVWLAGFHAAAALFHHFVLRDEVLLSMLPARWRRRRLS